MPSRMNNLNRLGAVFVAAFLGLSPISPSRAADKTPASSLVIVLDGLRPDYVTHEVMPNLYALGQRGVVCEDHHSIFPTVTRVNASSIATGSYPATHGLLGNSVYFPEVNPKAGLNTADAKNLDKIEEGTDGKLLTAPSLGEILQHAGKKLLAVSSGSSGSALLLNHKITGGGVINVELIRPASMRDHALQILGPVPPEAEPNDARNRWAVDAYLKIGLDEIKPDVTIMWLSDPDETAHKNGVGAPKTVEALKLVDAQVGRILATLDAKGMKDKVNVFVTSDHGFATFSGSGDLAKLLIDNKLKESADSTDVVVVHGAVYVKDHDGEKIRKIAELALKQEWVGAVFAESPRPGHPEGFVPGTLSFNSISWAHDRRADLLVSPQWTDAANQYGYKGTTAFAGVAGHGSSSPYEVHATLIAAGPGVKQRLRSAVPTSNADLAPTLLHLAGIEPPKTMNGRAITEILKGGPDPATVKVARRTYTSEGKGDLAGLKLELSESGVGHATYMNYTKLTRGMK